MNLPHASGKKVHVHFGPAIIDAALGASGGYTSNAGLIKSERFPGSGHSYRERPMPVENPISGTQAWATTGSRYAGASDATGPLRAVEVVVCAAAGHN